MALDPKKAKANLAIVKIALRKAALKGKDGDTLRVGFAFAPGKDKLDHILLVDPRKNARQLMAEIQKGHKDRKALCCGTATVIKEGGKNTLSIVYVKKLAGAERRMQEALKAMQLMYLVKLEKEEEDEDVAEALEEAVEDAAEVLEEDDAGDEDDQGRRALGQDDEERTGDKDQDEDEDKDDDDGEKAEAEAPPAPPAAAAPAAPPAAKLAQLGAAPQVWHQTRGVVSKSIDNLRAAIKKEYADEAPQIIADIDKNMAQLNRITERLDHRLAESLDRAHKAKDEAARKAELAKAKAILTEHIKYIQTEPLIAHIDSNPFGVDTKIKTLLMASVTHMAKVIS